MPLKLKSMPASTIPTKAVLVLFQRHIHQGVLDPAPSPGPSTLQSHPSVVMKRFVLALDLVDDPAFIQEYEEHHKRVWPGGREECAGTVFLSVEYLGLTQPEALPHAKGSKCQGCMLEDASNNSR